MTKVYRTEQESESMRGKQRGRDRSLKLLLLENQLDDGKKEDWT